MLYLAEEDWLLQGVGVTEEETRMRKDRTQRGRVIIKTMHLSSKENECLNWDMVKRNVKANFTSISEIK